MIVFFEGSKEKNLIHSDGTFIGIVANFSNQGRNFIAAIAVRGGGEEIQKKTRSSGETRPTFC
jgi:hypothetical protein